MLKEADYAKDKNSYLASLALWGHAVHGPKPIVILNREGSLQTTMAYQAADIKMMGYEERESYLHRLHAILQRIHVSGWAMWADEWHEVVSAYPEGNAKNGTAAYFDASRRVHFDSGRHYESTHYLSLSWKPMIESKGEWYDRWFMKGEDVMPELDRHIKQFTKAIESIYDGLHGVLPGVNFLDKDETATYLSQCLSLDRYPVRMPQVPMFLNARFGRYPIIPGNLPVIGTRYLQPISIKSWPDELGFFIPSKLQQCPFPYRLNVRKIFLGKEDARAALKKHLTQCQLQATLNIRLIISAMTGWNIGGATNPDGETDIQSIEQALEYLSMDQMDYGYGSPVIFVWDQNKKQLSEKVRVVTSILQDEGCTPIEESLNAMGAFQGALPGDVYHNVRRPLLPSLSTVFLMPHGNIWAGPAWDKHLNGPALLYGASENVPFRFVLHQGEIGHGLIIGPSRMGKSGFLGAMALQFIHRYEHARVFIFDKDYALYCTTVLVGGAHYDLGGNDSLGLQPFARLDESEAERRWAQEWVTDLFTESGYDLSPQEKSEIWNTIVHMAELSKNERTLTAFRSLFQVQRIKPALQAFCKGGRYEFFDADHNSFELSWWTCFEMKHLLDLKEALGLAMSHIFHQLDDALTGVPTLGIGDEAWRYMTSRTFAPKIMDMLKGKAKLNLSLWLSSQEVVDARATDIWQAIQGQCKTKLFLPNSAAMNPDVFPHYKSCGLPDAHIRMLTHMTPKRDYFYTSDEGSRTFSLALSPLERLLCAASTPEEISAMRGLRDIQRAGRLTEPLPAAWLRMHGMEEDADNFATYFPEKVSA